MQKQADEVKDLTFSSESIEDTLSGFTGGQFV